MLVTGEFAGAAAIAEQVIVLRKSQSLPPMPGPLAVLATCAHIQGRAAEARVHLAAARAALEAAPWTQDQHWLVQHATNVLEERHDGHMREDSPP
jgi:hypothetical protein